VVLFHTGVTWFPGGYVGVDVFFVISGYLITSLIIHEITSGRFSVVTFYERRIRRIFPALFTVLAVCSIIAALLFLPEDLLAFAKSLAATALFVSNVYFYKESGYFDAPPDTIPLLHTWSLAVEEQFYIVFPLIIILGYRWGGRRWISLLLAIFVTSLAASIWLTDSNSAAAFYLAPARAWELMLGALLASGLVPKLKLQYLREVATLGGVALIAWAVFRFSSSTPFPGWSALVPCLGAALLLYAGEDGSSVVGRMLSWQPVVFIGLISYSLYLWHWPLLVFARYWNLEALSATQVTAVIVASFVLATLSWAFVEQPFRRKPTSIPRKPLFAAAATATVAVLAFGIVGTLSHGLPARFSPQVLGIADQAPPLKHDAKFKELMQCTKHSAAEACSFGAPVMASYAVWGDSHVAALMFALGPLAARYGKAVKVFIHPGCPPLVGVNRNNWKKNAPDCRTLNNETVQTLEASPDIQTVILAARYALYIEGPTSGYGGVSNSNVLTDSFGRPLDLEGRVALFERQLDVTIHRLSVAGKTVVLVYPVPEISFPVPSAVGRLMATKRDPASLSSSLSFFHRRQDAILNILDRVGASERVLRVYPHKRLCDAERCIVYANGSPLYRDDNHLSAAGADFVAPELEPIFEPNAGRSPLSVAD
jgi:peptidoglycan/LPS O-acetylase OafA/YrhL